MIHKANRRDPWGVSFLTFFRVPRRARWVPTQHGVIKREISGE